MNKFLIYSALLVFISHANAADNDVPGRSLPGGLWQARNTNVSEPAEPGPGPFPTPLGWGPEVPVSDSTINLIEPRIGVGGMLLHVLAGTLASQLAYHFRAPISGEGWGLFRVYGPDSGLTWEPGISNLHAEGSSLFTVWLAQRGAFNATAYFRSSPDDGATWPIAAELVQRPLDSHSVMYSNVAGHGDTAFVAFFEDSLACWRSTDRGLHWAHPQGFLSDYAESYPPSICYGGGRLGIAYTDAIDGQTDIFFVGSADHGVTFGAPQNLGFPDGDHGQWPEIAADSAGRMAISWMDYLDSPHGWTGGIWCRVSPDGGENWGEAIRVNDTYLGEVGPVPVIDGDFLACAWIEVTTPDPTLHYRESTDLGATWGPDVVLDSGHLFSPRLARGGEVVHLAWNEDVQVSPGHIHRYIRYMRNDPAIGVWEAPGGPDLLRIPEISCYPNPFNAIVNISIEPTNGGDEVLIVYDVGGKVVKRLDVANGKAIWDATDAQGKTVSSGIYFARVFTPQSDKSIKLMYLR